MPFFLFLVSLVGIQPECAKLLFWGGQFMVGGFKKQSYTALRITTMLFIHLLGMLVVVEVWVETESMRRQK